jgi:hypothetical protein
LIQANFISSQFFVDSHNSMNPSCRFFSDQPLLQRDRPTSACNETSIANNTHTSKCNTNRTRT